VALASDDLAQNVGLTIGVSPDEPDEVSIAVVNSQQPTQRVELVTRPWKGHVFEFVVTLRAAGKLEVGVLGESRIIDVADFTPRKLALSCSGGWFTFSDVAIGP
jgi:hypothetical protein